MAKVVWTHEAERWLLKIRDYIAQDKPAAAFKVERAITQSPPTPLLQTDARSLGSVGLAAGARLAAGGNTDLRPTLPLTLRW